jgi:hypothetical protein
MTRRNKIEQLDTSNKKIELSESDKLLSEKLKKRIESLLNKDKEKNEDK